MAVAGKTKVQAQGRKILVAGEQIERSRQPQAQLVAIQRETFDLLENLGEVHRRAPHLITDFR
jgi:hypothetical protein